MGYNYEEAYLKDMRNKEVDLNPYCIRMNDQGKRVGGKNRNQEANCCQGVGPSCVAGFRNIIQCVSISSSGTCSSNSKRSSTQYYGSWKEEHGTMAVLFRYISYFHMLLAYIRS